MSAIRIATRLILAVALILPVQPLRAETAEVRISHGSGIQYLPLNLMEDRRLLERRAADAGLGEIKVTWRLVDGGQAVGEALQAGALDIAGVVVPDFLSLWDRGKGDPRLEVAGLGAVAAGSFDLNTRKAEVRGVADFTPADRIALPSVNAAIAALILEMAAAKAFGEDQYARLDPLVVTMSYPQGFGALMSGQNGVAAHLTTPPFSYAELEVPGIHRVFRSAELIGPHTIVMACATRAFGDANPKLAAAFVAALGDAMEAIARDKPEAVRLYLKRIRVPTNESPLIRMLEDPDTRFTVTPEGVMTFARFMQRIGAIGAAPPNWQSLFVPVVRDLPGS